MLILNLYSPRTTVKTSYLITRYIYYQINLWFLNRLPQKLQLKRGLLLLFFGWYWYLFWQELFSVHYSDTKLVVGYPVVVSVNCEDNLDILLWSTTQICKLNKFMHAFAISISIIHGKISRFSLQLECLLDALFRDHFGSQLSYESHLSMEDAKLVFWVITIYDRSSSSFFMLCKKA